jgi:hypothetical protein
MNIVLPVHYKNTEYLVEYNEPDSTHNLKDYVVRIVSIKNKIYKSVEMDEQIGKEFTFRKSDLNENRVPLLDSKQSNILELIIKAYRDHIAKDVSDPERV